ncbi:MULTISPECIES: Lrp/AsnC family transcriptional regulator [Amycolatopsis]|uniref:Lrp/AsnC family transcriptional regulator n=1 Tax=Amycolatopsis thermalba TaxID=944492 RepID=A0ABY4P3G3_9PSEU|nr:MULTISPECIES: Lrp/AsnC family transcriptional regulator [Amycolatopsis]OXM70970.1 AsnC family transcriptional regulator [Amycolatopsis sp. KNN50.9b]UQS26808.1 Lrp/AsnC family transcriptional regulator [Amycolatopsis thermalba]
MDELDSAIVRLLQEDARQSNRDIARKVGIAPSTCLERIRLLRKRGVIRGYHADIDYNALNRGVQAIVAAQIRPLTRDVVDAFERSLAQLPEVISVFTIAGSDDFLVHVTAQDIDHLHAFLLERFTSRREMVTFRTSIIYQHHSKQVLDPLPEARH